MWLTGSFRETNMPRSALAKTHTNTIRLISSALMIGRRETVLEVLRNDLQHQFNGESEWYHLHRLLKPVTGDRRE